MGITQPTAKGLVSMLSNFNASRAVVTRPHAGWQAGEYKV